MEVVKKLEVSGTISGQQLNEFLPNPTLDVSNEILAACTFKELVVEGSVEIGNSFNQLNLVKVLSDAVYEDSGEVTITAPKEFIDLNVQGNVNISSNFVNDINISDIMRTDNEQDINFERLQGDIKISSLKIGGLFDGINATSLEMESFRTFGDQFIESPLIFTSSERLGAAGVDVKTTLNDISVNDYFYVDQSIDFAPNVRVDFLELTVDDAKISNDIGGTGSLGNFNVREFEQNRFSKSRKQEINVPVEVDTLTTRGTFAGDTINGLDFDIFKNYMKLIKNYRTSLLSGHHKIDELIVSGNVNLKFINDRNFNELVNRVIWLNRENSFDNVVFLDDIQVKGNLQVENSMNGKNLTHFLKNWISKNENPIKIDGDVTTEKDIMVEENLNVPEINKIKFEDFLRKQDVVDIER